MSSRVVLISKCAAACVYNPIGTNPSHQTRCMTLLASCMLIDDRGIQYRSTLFSAEYGAMSWPEAIQFFFCFFPYNIVYTLHLFVSYDIVVLLS
jgi:hypothetical protein